jgi:polysaccharide deacetylase 2 family uncharacterized protein YibQ
VVKLPSRPKSGKKKRPSEEGADDFDLDLDGFHDDVDDGRPLFGSAPGGAGGGGGGADDFVDDLADGDAGIDAFAAYGDDDDEEDRKSGGGFMGKVKSLTAKRGEDDHHAYRDDDEGGFPFVYLMAVLLLGGSLVGGYLMVASGDKPATPPPSTDGFAQALPAHDDPRSGLMTPPTGAAPVAETDRSLERRPWLAETGQTAPAEPTPMAQAGGTGHGATMPPTELAVEPPPATHGTEPPPATQGTEPPPATHGTEPTPATHGTEPPPATHGTEPAQVAHGTEPPPAAHGTEPPPATQTAAPPPTASGGATAGPRGAFERPAAQLVPVAANPLPATPDFPVEDGFRPGRTPAYTDLPAPGSLGGTPLPDAPLTDLLRSTESGLLPVIAEDGRMAWRTYARPFTGDPTKPRVAIIVTGLGMIDPATEAAISQTPPDVTLAFSPYASNLALWMGRARQAGHETVLELPTEPLGFPAVDPGPLAVLSIIAELENRKRLDTVLGRAGGYVGVLATAEGRFTDTPQTMRPLLQSLKTRGLLYVHRGDTAAVNANNDVAPPVNRVAVELDQDAFQRAIDSRLAYLEEEARSQGYAVGVIRATPVALYRLSRWLDTLGTKGLALAPVSAVMITGERGSR